MIEHGYLIAGEIVPGSERVVRDSDAWWSVSHPSVDDRRPGTEIGLSCGHWTAGEAGVDSGDDDGPRVVRAMKARLHPTGRPLRVSVHHVIGATGTIWQTADPGRVTTVHVGRREVNRRSISTEVVSAGLPGPLDARHRPLVRARFLGRDLGVLAFTPEQIEAWVWLSELLVRISGSELGRRHGIAIPRQVPADLSRRWTCQEALSRAGTMEHFLTPRTTKIDAAGLLIGALADRGWPRV